MAVSTGIFTLLLEVVELDRSQWRLVRKMRLAALCDAPHAFVNTWAAEWGLPREYWQDRFADATWVAAVDGEASVGIARLAPAEPGAPHHVSQHARRQTHHLRDVRGRRRQSLSPGKQASRL